MAITITQRPEQTIYGMDSDWNGVGNPILYKMTTDQYAQDNYYLEVYVYNGATDVVLNSEPFNFTPDSVGAFTINVASILKANLIADFDIDLTNTNIELHDDANAYKKFYIKYKEVWTASANQLISDGGNQFFVVFGSRQIPSTYGGNFFEYTAFSSVDYNDAKFLTKLSKPVMWRGYPFILSAIIDDSLQVALDLKIVADATQYAGEQLNKAGKLVNCYFGFVSSGTIDDSDSAVVSIVDFATKAVNYTEELTIDIRDAGCRPIMLLARNSLGGALQWLFEVDQEYSYDYGDNIKAKRKVLRANNLTLNEWDAVNDFITLGQVYRNNIVEFSSTTIKTSSRVGQQVYVVETDGTKTGVVVIPTKNNTNTRRLNHIFELEIEYPEIFEM